MAEIIDLDIIVPEGIPFKIGGEIFEVPTSLKTETVIHLMQIEQKIRKTKDVEKILGFQDDMILLLFSQSNEVDQAWVRKLHQTQKSAILQHYKKRMNEINSNPN
ncbi:hypothetical protein [Mesobacillus sp. S13]|uniref:hypothetical protein n=1 Tax=Mesobacillus sp. S13 TaxID=2880221 RepID=UPI001CF223C2|nr:hypothetical protein [Mesobacillus sp. S13]